MPQNAAYLIHNGVFIKNDQFRVSHKNRAFRYGDSLFESMLVVNGNVPLLPLHYKRLVAGMKVFNYDIPAEFNTNNIRQSIELLLRKNKLFKTARLRLQAYRVEGGLYTPESNEFEYIIEANQCPENQLKINETGLKIKSYTSLKKPINPLSPFKTGNAALYVLAAGYKSHFEADDLMLFNTKDRPIETTACNFFVVKKNQLFTPPLSEGCTDGVMRKTIMQIADEKSISVREMPLRLKDILRADELFLTNAVSGIRWVVALNEKRYYSRMSKLLSQNLENYMINYSPD